MVDYLIISDEKTNIEVVTFLFESNLTVTTELGYRFLFSSQIQKVKLGVFFLIAARPWGTFWKWIPLYQANIVFFFCFWVVTENIFIFMADIHFTCFTF